MGMGEGKAKGMMGVRLKGSGLGGLCVDAREGARSYTHKFSPHLPPLFHLFFLEFLLSTSVKDFLSCSNFNSSFPHSNLCFFLSFEYIKSSKRD